ncbi:hypothetical protein ACFL2T_05640, partial [Elusimicrobiota bacterium]
FDAILARALAPLPEALGLTLPLARPEGVGMIYQSARPELEDDELAAAIRRAGARLERTQAYRLPGEGRERHLLVFRRDE